MNIKSVKTRVIVGALGALAIVGGVTGVSAYTASPADANPATTVAAAGDEAVTETKTLSSEAALKAAKAALKEAEEQNQRVTVAIVDRAGNTIALVKGDGAGPQTQESAERKAFTAVSFGKATSELTEGATGDAPNISDIPGTLFLAGGVPVTADKAPIAGIGVGGAPSGDIDEKIAEAGLKAID
ncbi:GlcG/HbpS family heme-binding protein [Stackebrandtia nassauensis]|nr:heme-binding protein [Stackebrandtia nassauensis]